VPREVDMDYVRALAHGMPPLRARALASIVYDAVHRFPLHT